MVLEHDMHNMYQLVKNIHEGVSAERDGSSCLQPGLDVAQFQRLEK